MTFGDKLKLVRQSRGLTQNQFADKVGTSRANISRMEAGDVAPTRIMINCIALTFCVDKNWLTDDNNDSLSGLDSSDAMAKEIGEKYIQLSDGFKELISDQIEKMLQLQEAEKSEDAQ